MLEFLYMPDNKGTGTPAHLPILCVGERVPWKTKNRSPDITRSGNSKHTPGFKTASNMSQGSTDALIFFFFQLADFKSSASFLLQPWDWSFLTIPYDLIKPSKFTFYGECWNVPSSFYSYKIKVGREAWPVFLDLPPHLASEFMRTSMSHLPLKALGKF